MTGILTPVHVGRPAGPLVRDDPGAGEFMVHRTAFTSADILEREREQVFDQCWLFVGHCSELPAVGDFKTRTVGGRPVIFCRDRHGDIRVLLNTCRHRGAMVCREPEGNASKFTCFYHRWVYRNSGELLGVPGKVSFPETFAAADHGLVAPPRTEIYRDFVFVSFSPDIEPLIDYLAGAREYLDAIVEQSLDGMMEVADGAHLYSMRCNWKLVVENSIDGYHGLPLHATYFQYIGSRGVDLSGGLHGVGCDLGNGHAAVEYLAPFTRTVARSTAPLSDRAKELIADIRQAVVDRHGEDRAGIIADRSKNIFIYPNFIVIDASSLQLRVLNPIGPDYTEISAWVLAPRGEDKELRQIRVEAYQEFLGPGGFATPDDCEALEACQLGYGAAKEVPWNLVNKGYRSDQPDGVDDEAQVRAFWRRWSSDVEVDRSPAVNGAS